MGYRSKVIFGVQPNQKDDVLKVMKEHGWIEGDKSKGWEIDFDLIEKDEIVIFDFSEGFDLKWYDGIYEDVDKIMEIIQEDEEEGNFCLVMGEDGAINEDCLVGDWWNYSYTQADIGLL